MSVVKIVGVGHYCPENAISNDQLSNLVDTSHEWIVKRTGIYERNGTRKDAGSLGASCATIGRDRSGR